MLLSWFPSFFPLSLPSFLPEWRKGCTREKRVLKVVNDGFLWCHDSVLFENLHVLFHLHLLVYHEQDLLLGPLCYVGNRLYKTLSCVPTFWVMFLSSIFKGNNLWKSPVMCWYTPCAWTDTHSMERELLFHSHSIPLPKHCTIFAAFPCTACCSTAQFKVPHLRQRWPLN